MCIDSQIWCACKRSVQLWYFFVTIVQNLLMVSPGFSWDNEACNHYVYRCFVQSWVPIMCTFVHMIQQDAGGSIRCVGTVLLTTSLRARRLLVWRFEAFTSLRLFLVRNSLAENEVIAATLSISVHCFCLQNTHNRSSCQAADRIENLLPHVDLQLKPSRVLDTLSQRCEGLKMNLAYNTENVSAATTVW